MTERDFNIKKGLKVAEDIELGHATDTTIARASAGQITVEGTAVLLAGAQTGITSILATDLIVGEDAQTAIDFGTADEIDFKAANAVQLTLSDGVFRPQTDSDVDLGTSSLFFKDAFIDKIQTTGVIELGHASDTTIARSSAGVVTIEGETVVTVGKANSVTEPMIKATNAGASGIDNYLLSYDHATTGFTWVEASSGGASDIGALDDVLMDATNFTNSLLIQTNSDTSAPTTGTLSGANENVGIGRDVFKVLTSGAQNVSMGSYTLDALTTGNNNTIIGHNAGTRIEDDSENTYIGAGAGANSIGGFNVAIGSTTMTGSTSTLHTGSHNVALGRGAMTKVQGDAAGNVAVGRAAINELTTGDYNIALGYNIMYNTTTGSYNIGLGQNALERNTTESNHIAIGTAAMGGAYNQTATGAYNLAIGHQAMRYGSQANGNYNIGIGYKALYGSNGNSSAANYNVAIGYETLEANTTGDDNVAVGTQALEANTTGTRNLAIGYRALDAADTENDNIAIGYDALGGAVAGGEKNLAIGNYAGDAITSGDANTLLGYNAGTTLTTGHSNIAIGAYALENSDVGTHNIAIGYEALECAANSDVDDNVAIGKATLKSAADGTSGNVAIGINALTLATKDDNVAIGFNAANSLTTGERSVFIGTDAGHALQDDNNSVIIGYQAGDNLTAGSGNVIIGCYTDAPSATADGQLVIGTSVGVNDPTNWIEGDSTGVITFNHKADVVAVAGNTVLSLAQTGSYVYWTSGTCTLPTSATVGTQFTVFNNTGGSATVALGTNNAIVSGWASNAAIADHEGTSYICVAATKWIQVG